MAPFATEPNPLFHSLPSPTQHEILNRGGYLADLVQESWKIEQHRFEFLLALGSIYVNRKRTFQNSYLNPGDMIRIHLFPKRYATETLDWRSRILFEDEHCVVINKPAGIPVPSTVDNFIENVGFQVGQTLNIPIFITHRLDVPVGGLLMLAKTKTYQTYFNRLLSDRAVKKEYLALVPRPIALGRHTHHMVKSPHAPKKLQELPSLDTQVCELEILSCEEKGPHYLCRIQLLTGRTHQIRSQLSFLGSPILGDFTYGGLEAPPFFREQIALQSSTLAFQEHAFSLPWPWP